MTTASGQAAEAMNTDYNDEPRPEDQSIIKSSWYDLLICDNVFGSLLLKATHIYMSHGQNKRRPI